MLYALGGPGEIFKFSFFKNYAHLALKTSAAQLFPQWISASVADEIFIISKANCCYPKCVGWMPLSQFGAIFLLEDVALLLYSLLILKISHLYFFRLKKVRPSSKIGLAMAGPTGLVPLGLYRWYLALNINLHSFFPRNPEPIPPSELWRIPSTRHCANVLFAARCNSGVLAWEITASFANFLNLCADWCIWSEGVYLFVIYSIKCPTSNNCPSPIRPDQLNFRERGFFSTFEGSVGREKKENKKKIANFLHWLWLSIKAFFYM